MSAPREIVVVELLGGFGDLLLVVPAVHALARAPPSAAVRVVTLAPGDALLAADPAVASVTVGDADDAAGSVARHLDEHPADLAVSTTMHSGIAAAGARNGLAQTLLRMTTPRVPDLYQGCERWDFSLVDPDNRQPVDFAARAAFADDAADAELLSHWRDGRIKQRLIQRTLALRAQDPELFTRGRYLPLRAVGERADRILAFLRELDGRVALVAVPRLVARLTPESAWSGEAFAGTVLKVPDGSRWTDVIGGGEVNAEGDRLDLGRLFAALPYVVLRRAA